MIYRYAELSPQELQARIQEQPLAIQPLGALEWHGSHLPLGLDGIVADHFCDRLAETTGAVLLPQMWLPITTLPHPHSLDFRPETVTEIWLRLMLQLDDIGFKQLFFISGHYAQGHMICLYQTALAAMTTREDLTVLAASPLELLNDDDLLDHAARWETSQLLSFRPDLVHLDRLQPPTHPRKTAILGQNPQESTPEEGTKILESALFNWTKMSKNMKKAEAITFQKERIASYESYTTKYYQGSWDQAIQTWWNDLT